MEGYTITSQITCQSCKQPKLAIQLKTAIVGGKYYDRICSRCIGDSSETPSSSAAGFDRRRQYEDNAADTIQPYIGDKPNSEFLRLYPEAARKVFKPEQIEQMKRKL